jgi:2'-5' RNA ligase
MGNESAVIIPVSEVEPIVASLRLQYDRTARLGVPAHITLLYPFCSPEAIASEAEILRNICMSIEAFSFSFTEVRRFPATAYLHPDKAEVIAHMTGTLVKKWPDYQPYNGAFPEIVPHLTVADGVNGETLATVERYLRRHLPIKCFASEIWLMTSDHEGMWSKSAIFPLATPKIA